MTITLLKRDGELGQEALERVVAGVDVNNFENFYFECREFCELTQALERASCQLNSNLDVLGFYRHHYDSRSFDKDCSISS